MIFPIQILPWKKENDFNGNLMYKLLSLSSFWTTYDHITIPTKEVDGIRGHTGELHVTVKACRDFSIPASGSYVYRFDFEIKGRHLILANGPTKNKNRILCSLQEGSLVGTPIQPRIYIKDSVSARENWEYTLRQKYIIEKAGNFWDALMGAQPEVIFLQATGTMKSDSLMLGYKIFAGSNPVEGKLDSNGFARIELPVGVKSIDCSLKIEVDPFAIRPIKPNNYMLTGGRYLLSVSGEVA